MKLKHRCSVEGCWKCGAIDYGKGLYFCKKHNPSSNLKDDTQLKSIHYDIKRGKEVVIINDI